MSWRDIFNCSDDYSVELEIGDYISSVKDLGIHFLSTEKSDENFQVVRNGKKMETFFISEQLQNYFCQMCEDGNVDEVQLIFDRIAALADEKKDAALSDQRINFLASNVRTYFFYYSSPISLVMRTRLNNDEIKSYVRSRDFDTIIVPMIDNPEEVKKCAKLLKLLLNHGANPYDECYYGRNAFFQAVDEKNCVSSKTFRGLSEELQKLLSTMDNVKLLSSFSSAELDKELDKEPTAAPALLSNKFPLTSLENENEDYEEEFYY